MTHPQQTTNRRHFLQASAAAGAMTWLTGTSAQAAEQTHGSPYAKGSTILFQGDSITDAGRDRPGGEEPNNQKGLGKGYAGMAATNLLVDNAGQDLKIYNRGISGHKVFQLAERWDKDCLDLKPNLVSILIGVNDIWHKLNGKYDGTIEVYENDYRALLKRTQDALPGVTLVVCEPFVLKCGAVNENWFPAFDGYRAAAKKVASEVNAIFVPFQSMFDEAVKYAPPNHFAGDGVHPSAYGASLMAHTWCHTVAHALSHKTAAS